jgi:hypothetical protein
VQVADCKLSKKLINLHIGDRALVRQFVKEISSMAGCSVQSPSIVVGGRIKMLVQRRENVGYIVTAHVNAVPQVLGLILFSSVLDGWGHIFPSLV